MTRGAFWGSVNTTCPRCGRSYPAGFPADFRAEMIAGLMATAVLVEAGRLAMLPWSLVERVAHESATVIASHADDLQFGGKHCREAFAALARGLAATSFSPGGVNLFGAHWCNRHPEATAQDGQYR